MPIQPTTSDPSPFIPADVWNNLAIDAHESGDIDEAERCWERALERDPQHLETIFNQGLHQWRTGQISDERMIVRLEEVATNRGRDWSSLFLLGQANLERGAVERARDELSRALTLNASDGIHQILEFAKAEPTASDLILYEFSSDVAIGIPDYPPDDGADVRQRSFDTEDFRELVETSPAHFGMINDFAWSKDGRLLASSSRDSTVRIWDLDVSECIRIIHAPPLLPTVESQIRSRNSNATDTVVERPANYPIGISFIHLGGTDYLLAGLRSGHVALWDFNALHDPTLFSVHDEAVAATHLLADGEQLLTAAVDGIVRCWQFPELLLIWEGAVREPHIRGSALSRDGSLFATCDVDAQVLIWDTATGEVRQTIQATRPVWNLDFHPDGDSLVTGDGAVWSISTGERIRSLDPNQFTLDQYGPDGMLLAGASWEPEGVALIDATTGRKLRVYPWPDDDLILSSFDPTGERLAVGGEHGEIRILRCELPGFAAAFQRIRSMSEEELNEITVTAASLLESIRHSYEERRCSEALIALESLRSSQHFSRSPETTAWLAKLERMGRRTTLRGIWQVAEARFETDALGGGRIASLSEDGSQLACFDQGAFAFWDLKKGECIKTVEPPGNGWIALRISPDHKLALWEDWGSGHAWSILVTDTTTDQTISTLEDIEADTDIVRFSHDNRFILTINGSEPITMIAPESPPVPSDQYVLNVWDVKSGRRLRQLRGADKTALAAVATDWFSDAFVPSTSGNIDHWLLNDGILHHTLTEHSDRIHDMASNPDCSRVLSASIDNSLRVWDTRTGASIRTIEGTADSGVGFVRWSYDQQFIVQDDAYNSMALRNLASGDTLTRITFPDIPSWRYEGFLTRNSRYLALGFYGGIVRVWYLDWDIEIPEPADWDEGARPFLNAFLRRHQPYAGELPADREPTEEEITLALTKRGAPVWGEQDFDKLIEDLRDAGFGWLRPERVRAELTRMASAMRSAGES